jgi:hypothetical protein
LQLFLHLCMCAVDILLAYEQTIKQWYKLIYSISFRVWIVIAPSSVVCIIIYTAMNWMQVPGQPKPTITKAKTRIGNLGHLTRIANRMIQASASNSTIQSHLQVYSLYQHLNQFQVTIHVTITGEPNIHLPKWRNPDIPWLF